MQEHGVENQPDIQHSIVPTCVPVNDHDESKLRFITARAPRREAKGTVASSPSRTSINKFPSPPTTSSHPPSSSPAQEQLPTGTQARSHLTTMIYTTSVTVAMGNSALGVASPSVTEPPRTATTIPGSNHRRVSPKTIIIVVVVVIIVILILIVAIIAGVLLWRMKRAQKGRRDGVLPKYHSVSCKEWSEGR